MNTITYKPVKLLALLSLLAFLTGCQHFNAIRVAQDRPEDLGTLMGNREYGRAEQLLNQYPYLDTPDIRRELNERVTEHETAALSDAQARESANDLYGANELLVAALRKLPHSTRLNEYKRQLDTKRAERRKENERRELLAQAEYYLAQQEIYNEHLNLDSPSLVQSWKNSINQHQAHGLAQRLLTCGQETLQDNLDMADKCLRHAAAINDSPEVQSALSQLETRRAATRQRGEKTVRITQDKEEKKLSRKQKNKTQEVLERTVQALNDDDLPAARRIFHELPKVRNESREAAAIRSRLHEAIESRVKGLTNEGDKRYRADNVSMAIRSWEKALELDPDNPDLTERVERARKVLARLDELKSRQNAPARQHKQGS